MRTLNLREISTTTPTLIEASAGTGKTWTITALYILLVLGESLRPEEILVVTYTRAATAELRDRIRKRLAATLELFVTRRDPSDELEEMLLVSGQVDPETAIKLLTRALYAFDNAAVFTIHGFCQRVLLENAYESGSLFDSDMTADQSALVKQVCEDFWRTRVLAEQGAFLAWLIARKQTPEKLAAPFVGHYQNPGLRVIPETAEPDLIPLLERRNALLPAVAAMWQAERVRILDLLHGAQLNQTSYKAHKLEAAALSLDKQLSVGTLEQGCACLTLFTDRKISASRKKDSLLPEHPFFALCGELREAALALEEAFRHKLMHLQRSLGDWLARELSRRKQARNLRSYDDLLLDLHLALEAPGGDRLAAALREQYRAALIDEFQDTDPLQWQIFARISRISPAAAPAGPYPLFLIGDPKQAIYSFRGADIHAYLAAARATGSEQCWTLETNRRSSAALVRGVNALFQVDDPFRCRQIAFTTVRSGRSPHQQLLQRGEPVQQPLRFWVHRREVQGELADKGSGRRAAVAATTSEIARLLNGGYSIVGKDALERPLKPSDMAVLVKSHYQGDLIQQSLQALGIPSVQHGSATIFESREARDLVLVMRAAIEPYRGNLVREALLTGMIGLSANEVFALGQDERAWEEWLIRFRSLHRAALSGGIMALAGELLDECGLRLRVLAHAGGERRLTNILHCLELLHQAEREQGLGLESLLVWLERRVTGDQDGDETTLLRLETDEQSVVIATIHASKGLEYPIVFIPFAWDFSRRRSERVLFHDDNGQLVLDLGSEQYEDHKHLAREEQDAEAVRLLYVAITRAEFLCYLTWGCINGAWGSPLRRLLHGDRFRDSKAFHATGDQDILDDINAVAERSAAGNVPAAIAARFMPCDGSPAAYQPVQAAVTVCSCRELQVNIPLDWRISSFSAIAGAGDRQLPHHDRDAVSSTGMALTADSAREHDTRAPGDSLSIFDFPRGAQAGTCLHELLEKVDFSNFNAASAEGLCLSCLQRNGYDKRWLPAVKGMLQSVVSSPLIESEPGFSLAHLQPGSWQCEMEFYLPVKTLSGSRIRAAFEGQLDPALHGHFQEVLDTLHLQETRGMLMGYMDMVFQHNGRYYIIDWKSNHLGDRYEAYGQNDLSRAMAQHAYTLQYHIYTLALDRLLSVRLPGYEYERHYGGALYLFLRGITGDSRSGIFHDRPTPEFLRRANQELLG